MDSRKDDGHLGSPYIPQNNSYPDGRQSHETNPYAGILPPPQPQYPLLPLAPSSNLPNQWPACAIPATTQAYNSPQNMLPAIAANCSAPSIKRKHELPQQGEEASNKRWIPWYSVLSRTPQGQSIQPSMEQTRRPGVMPRSGVQSVHGHLPESYGMESPQPPNTPSSRHNPGTQHNPVEIASSPEPSPPHPAAKERKKKKFHAVAMGAKPGIYTSRSKAWLQVDGYPEAKCASFETEEEARKWYKNERREQKRLEDFRDAYAPALIPSAEQSNVHTPTTHVLPQDPSCENHWPTNFSDTGWSSQKEGPKPYAAQAQIPYETPDISSWTTPKSAETDPHHSPDIVPIVEPELCEEQRALVTLILSRRNVFYTGSAGCGKSTVLKAFVKRFQERGLKVNIVAPTGRAALDIHGSTTWTYAGWTPDHHKKPLDELVKAGHGKFVSKRMRETDVLVIDEISMVENLHFQRLNEVMKAARGNKRAFGGVQLVVTGDFCQLPPVKPFRHCITCGNELVPQNEGKEYRCRNHGLYYDIDKWAFRSAAWAECDFEHVNLTTIHRQSDTVFIDILNKLRLGTPLSGQDRSTLLNHEHSTRNAVVLFPTRAEVKRVNDEKFNKLRSQPHPYHCLDHFRWNEAHGNLESKKRLSYDGRSLLALADHRYEASMQLKKGMLVVLLHNLDINSGLVNGSQGTIQGFEDYDPKMLPKAVPKIDKGKELGVLLSNQGLTGDYAIFRENQVKEFIENAPFKKWPIVTFLNGVTRTIYADCTVNELGDKSPYSLLSRTQVPLMAAWAMTTHKSQGMTLNRVRVDLAKAFEEGQAYVALSRARSLDGLEVVALPPVNQMGTGNPQVKEFLKEKFGL